MHRFFQASPRQIESGIILILVFLLSFFSFMYFGGMTASIGLDASWNQALAWAWRHDMQMGKDLVFTYGPLGYLSHSLSSYDTELYSLYLFWQITTAVLLSMLFMLRASQLSGRIDTFVFLLLTITVLALYAPDPVLLIAIVALAVLCIEPPAWLSSRFTHLLFVTAAVFLGTLISLTKFSNFLMISCAVLLISIACWQRYNLLFAFLPPALFAAFLITIWIVIGQSPDNLLPFLRNALNISGAYSEAMAGGFVAKELYLAGVIIAVNAVMALLIAFRPHFSLSRLLIALIVGFGLFLAFKAGFVRHDAHSLIFFVFATVVPFYLSQGNLSVPEKWLFHSLRYTAVIIAFYGLLTANHINGYEYTLHSFLGNWNARITGNANSFFRIPQIRQNHETTHQILKSQFALPKVKAVVGNATIDLFSWEQGVLFLNDLNWHPRPVFQSYAAYTPHLNALNGAFYNSDDAPAFVLFKLQAIDGQYPFMNDTEALKMLLRDYQPVLEEKDYLLLKRQPQGQGLVEASEILLSRTIHFDETVDLSAFSDQPLLVSMDIQRSLPGKLLSLLYRVPAVNLEVTTTDGRNPTFRLIPGMVRNSIVLNPLIMTQGDLVRWYAGQLPLGLNSLKITTAPDSHRFFKPDIHLTIGLNP